MICPICHKDALIMIPISKVSNTGERWILGYCTNLLCSYQDPVIGFRGENTFVSEEKLEEEILK